MDALVEVASVAAQPAAAVALVVMVVNMFTRGPRGHVYAIAAMAGAALLGITLAHWVVHPAAAICLAVLWTHLWGSPRKTWRPMLRGAVGVAVFGLLGAFWVVFPVSWVVAIWFLSRGPRLLFGGCGEKKAPRKVKLDKEPAQSRATSDAAHETVSSTATETVDLYAMSHDIRVPKDCRGQLRELRDRCRDTRAYLTERGLADKRQGHTINQIEHDFAPEAVRAYLQLPPTMANVAPLQDGKTGHQMLTEQLDLLLQGVEDVMAEATTIGGESLKASQRFLQDKFGERSDDLTL